MHVERFAQRRRTRPEVHVLRRVVIHNAFSITYLRKTIHHKTVEAKFADAALQFTCRSVGVLHRQCSKSTQTGWMPGYVFSQDIIRSPRDINRFVSIRDALKTR